MATSLGASPAGDGGAQPHQKAAMPPSRRVWPVGPDYPRQAIGVLLLAVSGALAWPALWHWLSWSVSPVWSWLLALLMAAGWGLRQWRSAGWLRPGGLLSCDASGQWFFSQPGEAGVPVVPVQRGQGVGWVSLWLTTPQRPGRAGLVCWRLFMHADDWRALRLALRQRVMVPPPEDA